MLMRLLDMIWFRVMKYFMPLCFPGTYPQFFFDPLVCALILERNFQFLFISVTLQNCVT